MQKESRENSPIIRIDFSIQRSIKIKTIFRTNKTLQFISRIFEEEEEKGEEEEIKIIIIIKFSEEERSSLERIPRSRGLLLKYRGRKRGGGGIRTKIDGCTKVWK